VPIDELAQVLWDEDPPASWKKALNVLMTKLRALLEECGIDRSTGLTSVFGCYQLTLPPGAWIDVDAAADAVGRAEAALGSGELDEACEQATEAAELARRSFLPGAGGSWVEEQRRDLRELLVRALECLRDASFAGDRFGDALRHAAEITELEPFRESSYRGLMLAHAAAGNPAEALRVYERCRHFLAEELGVYPSPETESVYLEILRSQPGRHESVDRPGEEGPGDELPPTASEAVPSRSRGQKALVAGILLLAAAGTAAALAFVTPDKPPVKLLPNSLVRLDPKTLKPAQVIKIDPKADVVLDVGGFLWVDHGGLRYAKSASGKQIETPKACYDPETGICDSGYRGLERINPSTGDRDPVSSNPCGMTPDPSGESVWVAECYADKSPGDVIRVDAKTRRIWPRFPRVPHGIGFARAMVYGDGWLWLTVAAGRDTSNELTRLNPRTGKVKMFKTGNQGPLAWSGKYGDLWMTAFAGGGVSRMRGGSGKPYLIEGVADHPLGIAVRGDEVWVGDWSHPTLAHFSAVAPDTPVKVHLPVKNRPAGVVAVIAARGYIWATVPDDHAVYRIDPKDPHHPTRIELKYNPWVITAGNDGIWVTLRAHDA